MKWKLGIAVAVLVGLPVAFIQAFKSLPVSDILNWAVVGLRQLLTSVLRLLGF
jgi:hypothetical protein